VAHDGPEGLRKAGTFHPEVVILDIGLPGLDGYRVATDLRRRPEHAGVMLIALTGYGQAEDHRRSMEAGFDYHLVKPADVEALQQLLSRPR
jgi:CheY-like chemotaxis protein